jgi:DNA repair protein RadC
MERVKVMSKTSVLEKILGDNTILKKVSIASIINLSKNELTSLGLNPEKVDQVLLSIEFAREMVVKYEVKRDNSLNNSKKMWEYIRKQHEFETEELFGILITDNKLNVLHTEIIGLGGVSFTPVSIRRMIKSVFINNGVNVVLFHNHPSGGIHPSNTDKQLTDKVIKSLMLVDIPVIDHIILGNNNYMSFADEGLI